MQSSIVAIVDSEGVGSVTILGSVASGNPFVLLIRNTAGTLGRTQVTFSGSTNRPAIFYLENANVTFAGSPQIQGALFLDPTTLAAGNVTWFGHFSFYAPASPLSTLNITMGDSPAVKTALAPPRAPRPARLHHRHPPMNSSSSFRRRAAFTTVEIIVAILLFSAATTGVLVMGKAVRDHRTAAATTSQQNAYATFQSEMALQGINPALVGNPLQSTVSQPGTTGTVVSLGPSTSMQIVRNLQAAFEVGAVSQPVGAQRNLAGSARVDAVNYNVPSAGAQATRGAGIGFGIETTGSAPAVNGIPLAPPSFNVQGDLTNVAFPINNIATLPSSNPAGTTYRYTLDGSTPTGASPTWNNNPGWTTATFPGSR